MEYLIDADIAGRLPDYRGLLIEARGNNSPTSEELAAEMLSLCDRLARRYSVEMINRIPAIAATRAAYKVCGKDPNRYRPSQEQLMRRIVRGLGLYTVNAIVDTGNLLSLITGCSVGCFDADKVVGDTLHFGIGHRDEPYEGIGRGPLNIEGLPVVRDAVGGIGTPTSDNERTKIELSTSRLLMTVHLFDRLVDACKVIETAQTLFSRYCAASDFKAQLFTAGARLRADQVL